MPSDHVVLPDSRIGPGRSEEVAPGVHVLGGRIPSDGTVSWTATRAGEYQPINCYLIQGEGANLLVDTGVALHEGEVMAELRELLAPGSSLSVFLTRTELECCTNLGAVADEYVIDRLFTGGVMNPFDAFDGVGAERYHDTRVQFDRNTATGEKLLRNIEVFSGRTLVVHAPLLRLLPTFWLFDPLTRTLFTSDTFGHNTVREPSASRVLRDRDSDTGTTETVASQLLTKFDWLRGARTSDIRADIIDVFDRLRPENVAPTHGLILVGRPVVDRHLSMLIDVLESCEQLEPTR